MAEFVPPAPLEFNPFSDSTDADTSERVQKSRSDELESLDGLVPAEPEEEALPAEEAAAPTAPAVASDGGFQAQFDAAVAAGVNPELLGTLGDLQGLAQGGEGREDVQPDLTDDKPIVGSARGLRDAMFGGLVIGGASSLDALGEVLGADFGLTESARDFVPKPESVVGEVVQPIAQFFGPFGVVGKALKGLSFFKAGSTATNVVAGGVADYLAFGGDEKRLGDLLKSWGIENEVATFTATNPNDSAIEGRLKNVLEGGVIGGGLTVAGKIAKPIASFIRTSRSKSRLRAAGANATIEDFARVHPEFHAEVNKALNEIVDKRQRVDYLLTTREIIEALDEVSPAFREAREFLSIPADDAAGAAAPHPFPDSQVQERVFHGTSSNVAAGELEDPKGLGGIFFTKDRAVAQKNAEKAAKRDGGTARVVEAFVDIKNPSPAGRGLAKEQVNSAGETIGRFDGSISDSEIVVFDKSQISDAGSGNIDTRSNFKLSPEAKNLVDRAEFVADPTTTPLQALDAQAKAARELSPIQALEQSDPEVAAALRGVIGDAVDGKGPGELHEWIAQERAEFFNATKAWEGVRTSDAYRDLPQSFRDEIDSVLTESRRTKERGFSELIEDIQMDQAINAQLASKGRAKSAVGRAERGEPLLESATRETAVAPVPTKKFLNGTTRMTADQHKEYLAAVRRGDPEASADMIAGNSLTGTNLNNVYSDKDGVFQLLKEVEKDFAAQTIPHAQSAASVRVFLEEIGEDATTNPAAVEEFFRNLGHTDVSEGTITNKILAYRTVELAAARQVSDLGDVIIAAKQVIPDSAIAKFMQATTGFVQLNRARRFLQADIARALSSQRIFVRDDIIDPDVIAKILREGVEPRQIAEAMRQAKANGYSAASVDAVMHRWGKTKALYGIWINGLLSGPATHVVNALSNTSVALLRPTEDLAGGVLDFVLSKGKNMDRMQEGVEAYADLIGAFRGSFRMAANAWDTGATSIGHFTTFEHSVGGLGPLGDIIGRQQDGALKSITQVMDKVFGLPGRMLISSDEFFKGLSYDVAIKKEARRYIRSARPDLKGPRFDFEVQRFSTESKTWFESSSRVPLAERMAKKAMHEKALKGATENTFTNSLRFDAPGMGGTTASLGSSIQDIAKAHPWFRVIMPFIRTPTNILRFAMDRAPILGLLTNRNFNAMKAMKNGDRDALVGLAGRMMSGTMMASIAASWAGEGRITGAAPGNAAQRAAWLSNGNQAYSFKIGDQWIAYNRLDPFGMQLGVVADIVNISGEWDPEEVGEMAGMVVSSMVQNLGSKRYLSGVFEAFRAFDQLENEGLERYSKRLAGSIVPSIIGAGNGAVDPGLKELDGWLSSIKARIPGWSSTLEPRLNLWGEPVQVPPGYSPEWMKTHESGAVQTVGEMISAVVPFRNRQFQTSEIRQRLTAMKFGYDVRRSFGMMGGVKLNGTQRNAWITMTNQGGPDGGNGGLSLEESIAVILSTPEFSPEPDFDPEVSLDFPSQAQAIKEHIDLRKGAMVKAMKAQFPELNMEIIKKDIAAKKMTTQQRQEGVPERLDNLAQSLGIGGSQ